MSYQQDAHNVVNFLAQKNDELWDKKIKLKEDNAHLLGIIEEIKKSSGSEPVLDTCTKREK